MSERLDQNEGQLDRRNPGVQDEVRIPWLQVSEGFVGGYSPRDNSTHVKEGCLLTLLQG